MSNSETLPNPSATLIKSLCKAAAYTHNVTAVRLIETHISWVLLTGQYAYKIKKPVNFGFLDFSTLEKRRFFCHEELRLNQRLAADWYLDVVPITGQPEQPNMDGADIAIEYALKMRQFPSAQTLLDRCNSGQLRVAEIDQISDIIANFHNSIEKAAAHAPYGDAQEIGCCFNDNFKHIQPLLKESAQWLQLAAIQAWGDKEWMNKFALMQQRKAQGYVRECHGDIHLGNMTLINGKVILFDCIEFNPTLRWIDVISEIAFLVMDLLHVGYAPYAYRFHNQYFQHTGDYHGLALLRYYLVYRALVRAKVALLRISQSTDTDTCAKAYSDYAAFSHLAEQTTQDKPRVLIITHGFSGSGKSTFAAQLVEKISTIQIRSDIERKRLFGYTPQAKTGNTLNNGIYTVAAGQQTYQHLAELAKAVLEAGFSAIIDAAFLQAEHRELFRQLACQCQVSFFIIDFTASTETLCARIRKRQHDASEATLDVLYQQLQSAQPLSVAEKKQLITVDTESDNALEILLEHLELATVMQDKS